MNVELSLLRLERRERLAEQVIGLLSANAHVVRVERVGSLAEGRADHFSDIDLVAPVRAVSNRELAFALPAMVAPVGECLVEGRGVDSLPETYVRTFYFADYPLFWHVDIGCLSDQHVDGSDLKQIYHWPQIFKMWIAVVKAALRGVDRVESLTRHIGRWADVSHVEGPPAQRLAQLLDLCAERGSRRGAPYQALYGRCDELRRVYLQN